MRDDILGRRADWVVVWTMSIIMSSRSHNMQEDSHLLFTVTCGCHDPPPFVRLHALGGDQPAPSRRVQEEGQQQCRGCAPGPLPDDSQHHAGTQAMASPALEAVESANRRMPSKARCSCLCFSQLTEPTPSGPLSSRLLRTSNRESPSRLDRPVPMRRPR